MGSEMCIREQIKRQAELLQSGKQPNLDSILQSLINIDKEAREASIHLGGPSSMLGQTKPAPAASAVPAPGAPSATSDAKPRAFWQGLIKWGSSGQSDDNMFTLVVASAMHFQAVQHSLALPWPNLMSISAFVPAAPNVLQQLITSRRVPCALLSLRPFPPNMAIRGAENNEQNYRMLAATLLQNQRAAYIPHGAPNCGLLLASVARHEPDAVSSMQNYGRPAFDRILGIGEPKSPGQLAKPQARRPEQRASAGHRERYGDPVTARPPVSRRPMQRPVQRPAAGVRAPERPRYDVRRDNSWRGDRRAS